MNYNLSKSRNTGICKFTSLSLKPLSCQVHFSPTSLWNRKTADCKMDSAADSLCRSTHKGNADRFQPVLPGHQWCLRIFQQSPHCSAISDSGGIKLLYALDCKIWFCTKGQVHQWCKSLSAFERRQDRPCNVPSCLYLSICAADPKFFQGLKFK